MEENGHVKGESQWKHFETYPPAAVRVMARVKVVGKTVRALTDEEIAIASGLPLDRVRAISQLLSWESVNFGDVRRFCLGCGFDPLSSTDRNRAGAYLRSKGRFAYLRKSPHFSTRFVTLINNLRQSAGR